MSSTTMLERCLLSAQTTGPTAGSSALHRRTGISFTFRSSHGSSVITDTLRNSQAFTTKISLPAPGTSSVRILHTFPGRSRASSTSSSYQQKSTAMLVSPSLKAASSTYTGQLPKLNVVPSARHATTEPATSGKRRSRHTLSSRQILRRARDQLFQQVVKRRRQVGKSLIDQWRATRLGPLTVRSSSSIFDLRRILGLGDADAKPEDAVFVAIDTEFRRQSVTEIGISTLDTRDIMDIKPDCRAANWISCLKHQHLVLSNTSSGTVTGAVHVLKGSLFCESQLVTAEAARTLILAQLNLAQHSPSNNPRKVHLVGHGIGSDVGMLRKNKALRLDISHGPRSDFCFDRVFDTSVLAEHAGGDGIYFPSRQLGHLARALEVDERYWVGKSVRGTHNASNDAAYTMMVLLLFAVRYKELPQLFDKSTVLERQQLLLEQRGMLSIEDKRAARWGERADVKKQAQYKEVAEKLARVPLKSVIGDAMTWAKKQMRLFWKWFEPFEHWRQQGLHRQKKRNWHAQRLRPRKR